MVKFGPNLAKLWPIFIDELFFSPIGVNHSEVSNQRTAFKSLGLAIEDFVAAKMAYEAIKTSSPWPVEFIESQKVKEMAQSIRGSCKQWWNFMVLQVKLDTFLHPNKHP